MPTMRAPIRTPMQAERRNHLARNVTCLKWCTSCCDLDTAALRCLSNVAREVPHSTLGGDDHVAGDAEEQAVLDDTGARAKLGCQGVYVGDGAEVAIEDHVARVGDELRSVFVHPDDAARAE